MTLTFDMTLKTFSAMPTHIMNSCGKSHWNPSTTEISRHAKLGVNGRTTDGRPDDRKT